MTKFQQYLVVAIIALVGFIGLRLQDEGGGPSLNFGGGSDEVLSGFETVKPWGTDPEKGFDLQPSAKYVSEGKFSLQVTYPSAEFPSLNTKKLKQNWGKYSGLAVDIFNPHSETIRFSVRLDDASRKRITVPQRLAPGWNHIHIPRTQIASRIDAARVRFIVLFIHDPKKNYTLYFDNLRLLRSKDAADASTPAGKPGAKSSVQPPLPVRKAVPVATPAAVQQGSLKLALARVNKEAAVQPLLVSGGIPFARGQLMDEKQVAFFDKNDVEVPVAVKVLARWPQDQSIRALLVQFSYDIPNLYQYVTMKWGQPRTTADLRVAQPRWEYPPAVILPSASWMCASGVLGAQVPMGQRISPAYDDRAEKYFDIVLAKAWSGDVRKDGYYSTPHVFYQLFVRSGDMKYLLAARKELLHYRDHELVLEGNDRGRSKVNSNPRYMYVSALIDDYLLTGDPRSLEVAGYMAEFLRDNFKPEAAFFPKNESKFWTERNFAFTMLGLLEYYELTAEQAYLQLAEKYLQNLYKTQLEWPSRGGFIHNLYAHDPEEGARPDEYGGSPFMTGLLLEAIIKFHQLTGSETAADSIFRALEWLMNEGLVASGDSFKYLTADKYLNSDGDPDVNLLIVHAFGYGYKISGYQDKRYLDTGLKVFARGVKDGFLGTRKHFNQNYRSSGYFLAYIYDALINAQETGRGQQQPPDAASSAATAQATASPDSHTLYAEPFEFSLGRFRSPGDTVLEIDKDHVYQNGYALRAVSKFDASNFSFGLELPSWSLDEFPRVSFAYQIPPGTPVGMRVLTGFGDWVCIGGTTAHQCGGVAAAQPGANPLLDDGQWHVAEIDAAASLRQALPKVKNLSGFQFFTNANARQADQLWLDDFKIKK